MELNTNIAVGFLFVVILVLLFSKISVSVGNSTNNGNNSNTLPRYTRYTGQNNNHPQIALDSGGNITIASAHGLPAKNDYMSNSLKTQIDELENKFYYNNCKWEPNF